MKTTLKEIKQIIKETLENSEKKYTLEDLKKAFYGGREWIWEDLEQTSMVSKYDSFEEWFKEQIDIIKENKTILKEELDMTKIELKKFIKDMIDAENERMKKEDEIISEKEVKELIKKAFVNYFRSLWEKRNMWINSL